MTFESTLPTGEPDLMRASVFQNYLDEMARDSGEPTTRLSSLSPSLLQDLLRFEVAGDGRPLGVLDVLAASVRHARALAVHLQCEDHVVTLTVFPRERLVHCPLSIDELMRRRLAELQVLHVEPAILRPPGDRERSLVGEAHLYSALAPVTWALALHGSRDDLLPEIAGQAAYRVAPAVDVADLGLTGAADAAVRRLQRQTTNLREIAEWPGFDRERAMRLLNALYLQAALIVSRTHPAATNEGWRSG